MRKLERQKQNQIDSYLLQDSKTTCVLKLRRLWQSYLHHHKNGSKINASICYGQCRGLLYALYNLYGREVLESKLMRRLSMVAERTPMHRY
jgi:hypothetical protein